MCFEYARNFCIRKVGNAQGTHAVQETHFTQPLPVGQVAHYVQSFFVQLYPVFFIWVSYTWLTVKKHEFKLPGPRMMQTSVLTRTD